MDINPPLLGSSLFHKTPDPPILLANWSSQVFLITRNATVKLSSINIIHVKQQHNVGFFILNFLVKYMPGNVYINKIHARQCLGKVFPILSISLLFLKTCFRSNFKTAWRKRFFNGATSNWFLYVSRNNYISINQQIYLFSLFTLVWLSLLFNTIE